MSAKGGNLAENLVKQITTQDFNEDSWRGFLQNCLRKGEITSRIAVALSDYFFGDNVAEDKHNLRITAIADCLEHSTQFVEHFDTLESETINNALELDKYFNSDEIDDDSEDSEFSDSVKLRIIRLMKKRCQSYHDVNLTKFKHLGLTQEKFQVFKKCVDSSEADEASLANVLNNLHQNKKFNLKLDNFARLAKVLEDKNLTSEELRQRNENRIKEAKSLLDQVFCEQKDIIERKHNSYLSKFQKFKEDSTKRKDRMTEQLSELEANMEDFEENNEVNPAKERLKNRIERLKRKIGNFPEDEKQMENQFIQQKDIIGKLKEIHHTSFKCVSVMLEASQAFENHTHFIQDIYEKIISIIEVPVALIVIGMIKTGKSTIVNKLLGEDLSPHRVEPMTAIPVRYINAHPEEGKERRVEMVVPFSSSLNKIIRILKKKEGLLMESDRAHSQVKKNIGNTTQEESDENKEVQKVDAPPDAKYPGLWSLSIHMLHLLSEISKEGFRFKKSYIGKEEVLKVSEQIHDFFRLCVQEPLLEIFKDELDLSEKLPLDWTKGLDSFLIVSLPLPDFDDATNIVDFSVVDTPGVNESGVEKLKLKNMIIESANSCHYLGFTISLQALNSEGDAELIKTTVQKLKDTPTIIFGTRVDQVEESQRDNLKQNILNFVKREDNPIPPSNIHLISGKMGSIAAQMETFIKENNKKPSPAASSEIEKKLAKEFIFYGCSGVNEQKKLNYYNTKLKTIESVTDICRDLRNESNMDEPIQQMKEVGVMKGVIVSIYFTLKKKEKIEDFQKYIESIIRKQTEERENSERRKEEIERATGILEQKIIEIRKNQRKQSEDFVLDAKKDLHDLVENFLESSELPEMLKGGQKEFKQEQRLEISDKVTKDLKDAQDKFVRKANEYLGNLSNKFKESSNVLKGQLEGGIIEELRRILSQQITNPEVGSMDVRFDIESSELANRFISQEQRKTGAKKPLLGNLLKLENPWSVRQNVIVVDSENLRRVTKEMMISRIDDILPVLRDKTRKMVNQLVENFFLRAMLFLNQENQILESKKLNENQKLQVEDLKREYDRNCSELAKSFQVIEKHHQAIMETQK